MRWSSVAAGWRLRTLVWVAQQEGARRKVIGSMTDILKRVRRGFGTLVRGITRAGPPIAFSSSGEYWERRYRAGWNSGIGSYGRLADFKAEVLNRFVKDRGIRSVIEFGCGDGAQLEKADYPHYLGVDVAEAAVDLCGRKFRGKSNYQFVHSCEFDPTTHAELTLSLDVIYHLVEDEAFHSHIATLFNSSLTYVVIYSSNHDEAPAPHVRHRCFTEWVEKHRPEFELIDVIRNRYPFDPSASEDTSPADFFFYQRSG